MATKKSTLSGIRAKMAKYLDKLHLPHWLTILLAVVLVLRIPSFFEPFSYGDEMIYLTLGEAIRRGVPLYSGIHDNKPPLLYILAAIAGNVFWFRVILAFWMTVTIVLFWKLTHVLFAKNPKARKIATIIFAILTTIPLFEGQIANAEVFMLAPTIGAFLILLTRKLTPKNLIFSGLLFSMATLFKVPAAFDMPVMVVFWLIIAISKGKIKKLPVEFTKIIKNTAYIAVGFFAPILLTFIWYFIRGAFQEYLIAAFLQNVGYLSSWRPASVQQSFLTRNGPVLVRFALVLLGVFLAFLARKKLSKTFILATIWLLFALFAITLSERPYPHYLIQAVPAISILFAILLTSKKLEQTLVILPLTLAFIAPVYYKFWYYPTASYYTRFLEFASGAIDKEQYFDKFDKNVNRNYKISDFIEKSTRYNDKVFVWGDGPPIYALSRRLPPGKYVATYHINDFSSKEEVINILSSQKPLMIVTLPGAPDFPELRPFLQENYILINSIEGAEIWRLMNAELRLLLNKLF